MPDEKSRSDLFNYRLMTVVSLLVLSVSVGSIIVYGSSLTEIGLDWKTAVFILPSTPQTLTITFIDKNHFQKTGRSVC